MLKWNLRQTKKINDFNKIYKRQKEKHILIKQGGTKRLGTSKNRKLGTNES